MKSAFTIEGKPIFKYGDHGKGDVYDVHVLPIGAHIRSMRAEAAQNLLHALSHEHQLTVVQDMYMRSDIYVSWR